MKAPTAGCRRLREVYGTWWFAGLFVLLAVNIAGAAAVRWPWRRHQTGFVVVHAGLLMLVLGFFLAGNDRLDGSLIAPPGQEVSAIELNDDTVSLAIPQTGGAEQRAVATFNAVRYAGYPSLPRVLLARALPWLVELPEPGIHVLAQPRTLLEEQGAGVTVQLLAVCNTARPSGTYLPTPIDETGEPAFRLQLSVRSALAPAAGEQQMDAHWLAPGGERVVQVGPLITTVATSHEPLLVEDFLHPPAAASLPSGGCILVYWHGHRFSVPVGATLPATTECASDLAIEVSRLVPHARIIHDAPSEDPDPDADLDPFVQLRIGQGPPDQRSWRDTTLAARYLLPALGADAPELLFLHPGVLAPSASVRPGQAAWLQALCGPQGVLHLRWFTLSHGLAGSATISTPSWQGLLVGSGGGPMQLTAQVTWLPHARSGPEPVVMQPGEEDHATRWIELGIEKDGHRGTGWIAHDDAGAIHLAGIDGAAGDVLVRYRSATYSLKDHHGFSLELERFDEATDPGGAGAATFASHVHIRGPDQAAARELGERLRFDEQQARERLADDAVGRWLPPALLALARLLPPLPPAVAGGARAHHHERADGGGRSDALPDVVPAAGRQGRPAHRAADLGLHRRAGPWALVQVHRLRRCWSAASC